MHVTTATIDAMARAAGLSNHTVRRRLTGLRVQPASARILDPVLAANGYSPGCMPLRAASGDTSGPSSSSASNDASGQP